ncbi:MAG: PHP domain-containing protein [Nocardioidaceae bacterium]|nr:PHP domain-containing protein [Nocardioidaceae bacterium]
MRIDLHTHSTASDGTQSPGDVMAAAVAAGLDVIALTDHDSAAGWSEAAAAAAALGVALVPGMEISTKLDGAGVHLLAYLPDPTFQPFDAELSRILAGREGRLKVMIEQLRAAGLDLTVADVLAQVGLAPAIGRPHIADAMIAKGIVASRDQAFGHWLSVGMPGYVERYATALTEMIGLVNAAGGVAVIAHPWGRGSRRVLDADTVADLKEAGLAGIEVYHQDHSPDDRMQLRALAADLDLIVTGSSDFHGDGKVDHDLACNLTPDDQLERLLTAAAASAKKSGRRTPPVVGL